MQPIYISYHTGGEYEASADELRATLCEFGLPHEIVFRESRGHWYRNLNQKPEVIRDMLRKYEGSPVVWLDADARVVQYPAIFDALSVDFACHFLEKAELLSSTMYFGPTPEAKMLVDAWCDAAADEPMTMDQRLLQKIVESDKHLHRFDLPESYACIFDRGRVPESEVVIRQMQLSRKTYWSKR